MPSPRSRNLDRKPQARKWIKRNSERSALFLEAIRILEAGYAGSFSGFVNKPVAEYRFNGIESGGYVILTARSNGSVRADVQLEVNRWTVVDLLDFDDLNALIRLISDYEIKDFDFENEKSNASFDDAVKASLDDLESERRERLKNANPEPRKVWRKVAVYVRNPDVVAEVLQRADGSCEACGEVAPFIRSSNGTPYLEVHHRKQLSAGGDDTVENAIALCPNCHRKEHFG